MVTLVENAQSAIQQAFGDARQVQINTIGMHLPINKPSMATQNVTVRVKADTTNEQKVLDTANQLSLLFKKAKGLDTLAAVKSAAEQQADFRNGLNMLKSLGFEFPENIDKWRGADENIGPAQIRGHLLNIDHSDESGTHIFVTIPKIEGVDNGKEVELVKSVLQKQADKLLEGSAVARLTEKGYLTLTDADKEAIKNLSIEVTSNEADKHSEVYVSIRSAKQKANKASAAPLTTEDIEAAKLSNPLNKLNEQTRGKLLGHVLLMNDKKIIPELVPYLGTDDMKALIRRSFAHYAKNHPTIPENIKETMERVAKSDTLIERNQWNRSIEQQQENKITPKISVDPDHPDFVTATLAIPYGKKDEALQALSTIPKDALKDMQKAESPSTALGEATPTPQQAIISAAGATPEAAAAGNITVCENPNHAAVSVSGAAATPEGALAGAGGACVDKNTLNPEQVAPEQVAAAIAASAPHAAVAPEAAIAPPPPVAVGNTVVHPQQPVAITPQLARSFLEKVQKEARAGANLGMSA